MAHAFRLRRTGTHAHGQQSGIAGIFLPFSGDGVFADESVICNLTQFAVEVDIELSFADHGLKLPADASGSGKQLHDSLSLARHLDHFYILAHVLELQSGFKADRPGANDHNLFSQQTVVLFRIGCPVNVGLVDAGDASRNDGIGPVGNDDGFIALFLKHFCIALRVHEDTGAVILYAFVCLMAKPGQIILHIHLERCDSRLMHITAQMILHLVQCHVMTALTQCLQGSDTRGASSHNCDFLLHRSLGDESVRKIVRHS